MLVDSFVFLMALVISAPSLLAGPPPPGVVLVEFRWGPYASPVDGLPVKVRGAGETRVLTTGPRGIVPIELDAATPVNVSVGLAEASSREHFYLGPQVRPTILRGVRALPGHVYLARVGLEDAKDGVLPRVQAWGSSPPEAVATVGPDEAILFLGKWGAPETGEGDPGTWDATDETPTVASYQAGGRRRQREVRPGSDPFLVVPASRGGTLVIEGRTGRSQVQDLVLRAGTMTFLMHEVLFPYRMSEASEVVEGRQRFRWTGPLYEQGPADHRLDWGKVSERIRESSPRKEEPVLVFR